MLHYFLILPPFGKRHSHDIFTKECFVQSLVKMDSVVQAFVHYWFTTGMRSLLLTNFNETKDAWKLKMKKYRPTDRCNLQFMLKQSLSLSLTFKVLSLCLTPIQAMSMVSLSTTTLKGIPNSSFLFTRKSYMKEQRVRFDYNDHIYTRNEFMIFIPGTVYQ